MATIFLKYIDIKKMLTKFFFLEQKLD